jgi:hypothetical protein
MLIAGSDDGVYRISGLLESGGTTAEKLLDADRVFRVKQFDGLDGLFVAAKSGLYYSPDGDEWTTLPVPDEEVYVVGGGKPRAVRISRWRIIRTGLVSDIRRGGNRMVRGR